MSWLGWFTNEKVEVSRPSIKQEGRKGLMLLPTFTAPADACSPKRTDASKNACTRLDGFVPASDLSPKELHERWLSRVLNVKPMPRKCMVAAVERKVNKQGLRSTLTIGESPI